VSTPDISVSNIRREGDEVCATLKVKFKGSTLYERDVCVRVNACITLYDSNILGCDVKVEACATATQLCLPWEVDCGFIGSDDGRPCWNY
jgi:hypothetical protein